MGQIKGFKDFLSEHHYRSVAIVSSTFHLPRVARTVGENSPNAWDEEEWGLFQNILGTIKCYLLGIDKAYCHPGTEIDLESEPKAMANYSSGFDGTKPAIISKWVSKNVFLSQYDVEMQKSFEAHKAEVRRNFFLSKLSDLAMVIPKAFFDLTLFGSIGSNSIKAEKPPEEACLLITNEPA